MCVGSDFGEHVCLPGRYPAPATASLHPHTIGVPTDLDLRDILVGGQQPARHMCALAAGSTGCVAGCPELPTPFLAVAVQRNWAELSRHLSLSVLPMALGTHTHTLFLSLHYHRGKKLVKSIIFGFLLA